MSYFYWMLELNQAKHHQNTQSECVALVFQIISTTQVLLCFINKNCDGYIFFTTQESHDQQPDLATGANHEEDNRK